MSAPPAWFIIITLLATVGFGMFLVWTLRVQRRNRRRAIEDLGIQEILREQARDPSLADSAELIDTRDCNTARLAEPLPDEDRANDI